MAETTKDISLHVSQRNSNIAKYFNEPTEWDYRCEGSWTMVLSLSRMRTVVRLRKRQCFKTSSTLDEEGYLRETFNNLDFAKRVILPLIGDDYVHVGEVISVPRSFSSSMNEICRSFRPAHRLDKEIDEKCAFGVVMPDFCFVPLTSRDEVNTRDTNQARNPAFSVEIKPKCGFLPTSPYIDRSRALKYSMCQYCLLQKSKVKEGKYKRQSKYCPLDLFSSKPQRVMYALECLVSDPQNNLRVFCDGKDIFTEELVQEAIQAGSICCAEKYFEVTLKEMDGFNDYLLAGHKCEHGMTMKGHKCEDGVTKESIAFGDCMTTEGHQCGHVGPFTKQFLGILLEILISDSKRKKLSPNTASLSPTIQVCEGSKYPDSKLSTQSSLSHLQFGGGGVLNQLLSVQKLDNMDVEGIYQLYQKVVNHFECNPGLRDSLDVNGPYSSPLWKSVASSLDCNSSGISNHTINTTPKASNCAVPVLNPDLHDQNILHDTVLKICEFAVAQTAKDCSVMIAFQKASRKDDRVPTVETFDGDLFLYNIDLVDLDPKEFNRVLKYYKETENVVKNYLE